VKTVSPIQAALVSTDFMQILLVSAHILEDPEKVTSLYSRSFAFIRG
jgi:hypothetical protein